MKTVQSAYKPDDGNHLRLRRDALERTDPDRRQPRSAHHLLLRNQGWERIREHFTEPEGHIAAGAEQE
jgi:hypothetical protein